MGVMFVGREPESAAIAHHLDGARRGHSTAVVLRGAPGIGKSTLLARTVDLARASGFEVLTLPGERIEADTPYDGLRTLLAPWSEGDADLSGGRIGAVLEAMRHAPEPGWIEVAEVARQCLESAAFGRPVLLAVDDCELCDLASLDVIVYLARHLRRHRALVVATLGSDAALPSQLVDDVRRLHASGQITVLPLGEFDERDVADLVALRFGRPAAPALVDLICDRTGGLPFFAVELLDALGDRVVVDHTGSLSAGPDAQLPRRVAVAILHRVFELGANARQVATPTAALGALEVGQLPVVAAVAGLDPVAAEAGFDRLVRARILADDGDGEFRFTHRIVGEALLADLSGRDRRRLHREIALALAGQSGRHPVSATLIAEHLRLGPGGHDRSTAQRFVAAGDELVHTDARAACGWYREALRRVAADDVAVPAVQLRLANALALTSRCRAAKQLVAAIEPALAGPLARRQASEIAVHAAVELGQLDGAAIRLDRELSDPAGRRDIDLMLRRARIHIWRGEPEPADHLCRVAEAAEPSPRPLAVLVRAELSLYRGEFAAGRRLVAELDRLATLGPGRVGLGPGLVACLANAVHFDPATAVAAGAVADGAPMAAWYRAGRAWAHLRRGQLDLALAVGLDSSSRDVDPGDGSGGLLAAAIAIAAAERGDGTTARAALDRGSAGEMGVFGVQVAVAEATVAAAQGEPDRALTILETTIERRADRLGVGELALVLAAQVDVATRARRRAVASTADARLQAVPADEDAVAVRMSQLLSRALVGGDTDDARRARAYADANGLELDAARASAALGVATGDRDLLAEAYGELGRLHALVRQRELDEVARPRGGRAGRGARGLSAVEAEVVVHVAEGLTNREVAARVHLSPKTVEVYLSRIYAKTGCRTRVDLAVAVRSGALSTSA